jgi:hypothetical protein
VKLEKKKHRHEKKERESKEARASANATYWDRERDLVPKGTTEKRDQAVRDASALASRFNNSGNTSSFL